MVFYSVKVRRVTNVFSDENISLWITIYNEWLNAKLNSVTYNLAFIMLITVKKMQTFKTRRHGTVEGFINNVGQRVCLGEEV